MPGGRRGSCGLGRCQWQSLALWRRRRRLCRHSRPASSTTCGCTALPTINGLGLAGRNSPTRPAIYPAQPVVGSAATTTAAGTCGLAVGDAPLSCSPISLTGAFPGSRWAAKQLDRRLRKPLVVWRMGLSTPPAPDGNGALNDLWVYTPNSTPGQLGTWAWIKGSNTGARTAPTIDKLILGTPTSLFNPWRAQQGHVLDRSPPTVLDVRRPRPRLRHAPPATATSTICGATSRINDLPFQQFISVGLVAQTQPGRFVFPRKS